ncbi:hypothetical protein C8R43DRAFT_1118035 [Mycena crocata]|nr:hypothetical protein C8R43DRAFT_1118035 [Mycena crocata]
MAKTRKRRIWKRKAKEDRRSNKLWAEGARESVLRPHIERYADALERGWTAERDYLQKVCNEYHVRISWRLADHEEPELPLPTYDPLARAVAEELTKEERVERHARWEVLNERIRRWLKYCARSLRRGLTAKIDPRENPFAVLLAKLSGLTVPPKARQAFQQYMRESYDEEIGEEVEQRWWREKGSDADGAATTKKPNVNFRCKVARKLFAELSEERQQEIRQRALKEARDAKKTYEKKMKDGPSKEPEARQRCIDKIGTFMGPILKGIQEYTGLQAVCIFGGPMPKYNGELGTTHVTVGENLASLPTHFAAWDKARFSEVLKFVKEYLATAYTEDECRLAALSAAADLDDAPFKFASENEEDIYDVSSDSDDSQSDDSDSDDSGSESGSEGGDEAGKTYNGKRKRADGKGERRGGKKPKRTEEEKKKARSAKIGRQYEAERTAAIARNKKLLEDLDLKNAASAEALGLPTTANKSKSKPGEKTKKTKEAVAPPPLRRSGRKKVGEEDTAMTSASSGQETTSASSGEEGASSGEEGSDAVMRSADTEDEDADMSSASASRSSAIRPPSPSPSPSVSSAAGSGRASEVEEGDIEMEVVVEVTNTEEVDLEGSSSSAGKKSRRGGDGNGSGEAVSATTTTASQVDSDPARGG